MKNATLEGIPANYSEHPDPLNMCYQKAKRLGYKLFGLQDAGCLFFTTYDQLTNASDCDNGIGSKHSIDLYYVLQGEVYY